MELELALQAFSDQAKKADLAVGHDRSIPAGPAWDRVSRFAGRTTPRRASARAKAYLIVSGSKKDRMARALAALDEQQTRSP